MKTNSSKQTKQSGKKLAEDLNSGDIILLDGNLGSGKTTFVKGICEYFGISKDEVRSPTFTLMNTYSTLVNQDQAEQIVHIDTYRMDDEQELIDIGVEEFLEDKNSIVLVEWPEKIKDLVRDKNTKTIKFEHVDKNKREIKTTE